MNPAFFLEILNGSAVTPEFISLLILGLYLCREARRRGLRFFDWFKLPAGMNLILAVFIFDTAILTRSWVIWGWRRFDGAGEFGVYQTALLVISGIFILVGSLCKIRALTYLDYGNGPWLAAADYFLNQ